MANLRSEDVMSRNPRCCDPKDTLLDAIRIMKEINVGYVPVCGQDKRLLGVITDRDIALSLGDDSKPSQCRVSEVMARDPITTRPSDDAMDAARLMEEHQIRRIPVVDNDNILLGVIATADIARRASGNRELEGELPRVFESVSSPEH